MWAGSHPCAGTAGQMDKTDKRQCLFRLIKVELIIIRKGVESKCTEPVKTCKNLFTKSYNIAMCLISLTRSLFVSCSLTVFKMQLINFLKTLIQSLIKEWESRRINDSGQLFSSWRGTNYITEEDSWVLQSHCQEQGHGVQEPLASQSYRCGDLQLSGHTCPSFLTYNFLPYSLWLHLGFLWWCFNIT